MHPINLSTSAAIFHWAPACVLRIGGDDALSFLQGQFSNDLRRLESEPAVYGLWLTLKGKVLADSFVMRSAKGHHWISSYFSPAAVIRDRLESHVIADDVTIEDVTAEWAGVSVFGSAAEALLADRPQEGRVFRGRRTTAPHVEWIFPRAQEEEVRKKIPDTSELDVTAIARLRIADGIPAVPVDIGPADLPNEGGLEQDAVSYNKGCYLGQEVMARLKAMGQVRRRLLRVGGTTETAPQTPAPLFAGEKQAGELRSAISEGRAGWIGLAMVTLLHVRGASGLSFVPGGPGDCRWIDKP